MKVTTIFILYDCEDYLYSVKNLIDEIILRIFGINLSDKLKILETNMIIQVNSQNTSIAIQ